MSLSHDDELRIGLYQEWQDNTVNKYIIILFIQKKMKEDLKKSEQCNYGILRRGG